MATRNVLMVGIAIKVEPFNIIRILGRNNYIWKKKFVVISFAGIFLPKWYSHGINYC
jgi:hypothetical protein